MKKEEMKNSEKMVMRIIQEISTLKKSEERSGVSASIFINICLSEKISPMEMISYLAITLDGLDIKFEEKNI